MDKNEIEKILRDNQEQIANAIERFTPLLLAAAESAIKIQKQFAPIVQKIIQEYGPTIIKAAKYAQEWQKQQKISISQMAEYGWFPNWCTLMSGPRKGQSLDDFMIECIDLNWNEVTQEIIKLNPHREEILKIAFFLHRQGNYIASIPLMLSQSDGICSEEFTHFFSADQKTGRKASEEILAQAENGDLAINAMTEILLEPFKVKLQITQSSSRHSKKAKEKGPNRHGILHGSRKHLDYGTKINGYKAFSFLAFLSLTVKDALKKGRVRTHS